VKQYFGFMDETGVLSNDLKPIVEATAKQIVKSSL